MAGEKDAASIFPWSEEGRPDQLLMIAARTCVCARTRWLASARSRRRRVTPVSIHTADYVERTVKWKRRRHNRSRYGIINAVPLNFCAPLSSNSSDELVRGKKKTKKKKLEHDESWKSEKKGDRWRLGVVSVFRKQPYLGKLTLGFVFNYSSWYFFFLYIILKFETILPEFSRLWKNDYLSQVWEELCIFKRRKSIFHHNFHALTS